MSLNELDHKVLSVLRFDPQSYRDVYQAARDALPILTDTSLVTHALLRLQAEKMIEIASDGMLRRIDGEGKARVTVAATFEVDLTVWAEEYGLDPQNPDEVIEDVNEFLVSYVSEPHKLLKLIGSRAK